MILSKYRYLIDKSDPYGKPIYSRMQAKATMR